MAGRMLPPKEFGFIVVANTILFGSQCLLLGPITNPTLRFGAISEKSLLLTYWIYCAVTGLVCSGFLLFGAQLGRIIYPDPSFFTLIKFLGIPFATTSFYAVQKLVLFARARYKIVLSMDVIYASSNIVILFLLHSNGRLSSAIGFYLSRSGAAVIGLLPVLCLFTWSTYQESPELEKHFSYRDYLQHSKYSSISMLSSYGQSQVDTLAVAHFLTPLNAATYGAAKIFYTGITMVTTGLTMVVLPASSRIIASGKGGLGRFYRRALILAYAILLPSVCALAALSHPFLRLLFGGRYTEAVPIVRIFCLAALVIPVSSITDAIANGAGWWHRACAASITGCCIGMVASLGLTRALGLSGAALAPVLALSGSAGVIAFLTRGRLGACDAVVGTDVESSLSFAREKE